MEVVQTSNGGEPIRSLRFKSSQHIQKKPWTPEEDSLLSSLVKTHGAQKWSYISAQMKDRAGKQCRERWTNHLNPRIKRDGWSEEEEWVLFLSHVLMGNRWAEISRFIPGRTDNCIKNQWNSAMRKKLDVMGQRLSAAIAMLERSPDEFSESFSNVERQLIKRIAKEGAFDSAVVAPKLPTSRPEKGAREVSLTTFETSEGLIELIEAVERNFLSAQEISAVLEFIRRNEAFILPRSPTDPQDAHPHSPSSVETPLTKHSLGIGDLKPKRPPECLAPPTPLQPPSKPPQFSYIQPPSVIQPKVTESVPIVPEESKKSKESKELEASKRSKEPSISEEPEKVESLEGPEIPSSPLKLRGYWSKRSSDAETFPRSLPLPIDLVWGEHPIFRQGNCLPSAQVTPSKGLGETGTPSQFAVPLTVLRDSEPDGFVRRTVIPGPELN